MIPHFEPNGAIAACLLPFAEDLSIDEVEFGRHVKDIASVKGITAIAQAGEAESCSRRELERVLQILVKALDGKVPAIASVYQQGPEAADYSKFAEQQGVSALMLYPHRGMYPSGRFSRDVALEHVEQIASASSLPIMLFQFPSISRRNYPLEFMVELIERFPSITSIKDWSCDPLTHDRNIRVFQSHSRPVNILTAHSSWLMGSLAMGCNGLSSSAGSIIPEDQVALFEAIKSGNQRRAKSINEHMQILIEALYTDPAENLHTRTKVAAVELGRMKAAFVRPPLTALSDAEVASVRDAVRSYLNHKLGR